MNAKVREAIEMGMDMLGVPTDLEINDVVSIMDVWDGNGEQPEESYSYPIDDDNWLTFWFEYIDVETVWITNITIN